MSRPLEAPSLQTLCDDLTAELTRDPRGRKVAALLAEYAAHCDCWAEHAHFDRAEYTRNLIHKNEHYELLLLCWEAGQASPIHNHMEQHCWMAVVEGVVEEVQFRRVADGAPLQEGRTTALERGGVAYIHDDIALHLVRSGAGARGASLHLYARPYATCLVYDRETGAEERKALVYHSLDGRRLESPVDAGSV